MTRVPDHLDHLADALSEDIVAAPAEQLIAEAAEDAGRGDAFATAFDRVVVRATRQARRRQFAERVRDVVSGLAPRRAWRPALAVAAGLAVIVVAGDLYLHVEPLYQPASAPPVAAARDPVAARPAPPAIMARRAEQQVEPQQQALAPSVATAPPPAAANQAQRAPAATAAPAAAPPLARPQPPADRLRGLIESAPSNPSSAQDRMEKRKVAAPVAEPGQPARADAPPSFVWPLRGRVVAHFRSDSNGARNDGLDIAAPAGSDVHAADDGVVIYAGDDIKGFGNLILVRHRDDVVTAYAYASRLLVKRADTVRRGQVIAKSGSGGAANVPMLHFEMRKDGTPVDPAQYLPPEGPATSAR